MHQKHKTEARTAHQALQRIQARPTAWRAAALFVMVMLLVGLAALAGFRPGGATALAQEPADAGIQAV